MSSTRARVLIVAINFAPEPTGIGPYVREYADLLVERGFVPTVLTGLPHYPRWQPMPFNDHRLPYEVRRVRHYVPKGPSSVARAMYEFTFALGVWLHLQAIGPRFDAVVVVSPALTGAAVAAEWSRRHHIPVGAVIQDIVSAAIRETGMGGSALSGAASYLERRLVRSSTLIGVITERMIPRIRSLGVELDRIRMVQNWPLGSPELPDHGTARQQLPFRSDVLCVHAGNMGRKQGLEVVVEAASIAHKRGLPVAFLLCGDGNQRPQLERLAVAVPTLRMLPLLEETAYWQVLAGADVLLLCQRPTVDEMALPSKLTSYLRAGRPIAACVAVSSAAGVLLTKYGAAYLSPPGDANELLRNVIAIAEDREIERRLLDGARKLYAEQMDPVRLRGRFVDFVEGLLGKQVA